MDEPTIYLNHAGTSWPKPIAVGDAVRSALSVDPMNWPDLFRSAHQTVSDFFHVDRSRLLVTPSCTAALGIAVMDHPWRPGDSVLSSGYEHHALHRTIVKLTEQGVEHKVLPRSTQHLIDLEALESELKLGAARLLALTAACNVTGQLLPINEAIDLAHQYGTLVLIDGAQIAGWWDFNLMELNADLFTFAGHKGPQAPWGVGGLYVSERISMNCPFATCERTTVQSSAAGAAMPGFCDAGSVNLTALAGMSAACHWLQEPGQKDRLQHARSLAAEFADSIREFPGLVIHCDEPVIEKMPTVAITVDDKPSTEVAKRLRGKGVIASGGFQCAPQAHQALGTDHSGVVRFSFGPGTTASETTRAVRLLQLALHS